MAVIQGGGIQYDAGQQLREASEGTARLLQTRAQLKQLEQEAARVRMNDLFNLATKLGGEQGYNSFMNSEAGQGLINQMLQEYSRATGRQFTGDEAQLLSTQIIEKIFSFTSPTEQARTLLADPATRAALTEAQAKTQAAAPTTTASTGPTTVTNAGELNIAPTPQPAPAPAPAPPQEPAATLGGYPVLPNKQAEEQPVGVTPSQIAVPTIPDYSAFAVDFYNKMNPDRPLSGSPEAMISQAVWWINSSGLGNNFRDAATAAGIQLPDYMAAPTPVADPRLVEKAMTQPTSTNITTANKTPGSEEGKAAIIAEIKKAQSGPLAPLSPAPNAYRAPLPPRPTTSAPGPAAQPAPQARYIPRPGGMEPLLVQPPAVPPTPSPTVSPTQAPGGEATTIPYKVVSGDTMGKIALRNNLTLKELAEANPQIKNLNAIRPDDIVNVPVKPNLKKAGESSAGRADVKSTGGIQAGAAFQKVKAGDVMGVVGMVARGEVPVNIPEEPRSAVAQQQLFGPVTQEKVAGAIETIQRISGLPTKSVTDKMKERQAAALAGTWANKVYNGMTAGEKVAAAQQIVDEVSTWDPAMLELTYGTDVAGRKASRDSLLAQVKVATLNAMGNATGETKLKDYADIVDKKYKAYEQVRQDASKAWTASGSKEPFLQWAAKDEFWGPELVRTNNEWAVYATTMDGVQRGLLELVKGTKGVLGSWAGILGGAAPTIRTVGASGAGGGAKEEDKSVAGGLVNKYGKQK